MKITKVVFAEGRTSFLHQDRDAIRAGAKPNGFLFEGAPVTPGFTRIVEPAGMISIVMFLENGQVAYGDCVDVILAGHAGRDRVFLPKEHIGTLETHIRPRLEGRELSTFREMAQEFDTLLIDGQRMHTALRYGITQVLLHACAVAEGAEVSEVVAREYGTRIMREPAKILVACQRDNYALHDRMILKRADLLPHASFGEIDIHIGRDGKIFLDYVEAYRKRVQAIGDADYNPGLHFDVYGSIGELFEENVEKTADYLSRCADLVAPYDLFIESPFVVDSLTRQIDIFGELKEALRRKGTKITIVADEWCNTAEDIKLWADAGTADMVQIKMPDLGGINNTIEASAYCKDKGQRYYLGGSINETLQPALLTSQIALATQPEFMFSKPGLGGDESYALLKNEMTRAITVLTARGSQYLS